MTDARSLARTLIGWGSVTGSPGEVGFASKLADLLRGLDLETHVIDSHGETRTVAAVVRGRGTKAVLLTGHYDVVAIDNMAPHQALAYDPEALTPVLAEELRGRSRTAAEELALADLASGEFWAARGALDMKSGLAAGIAALLAFAAQPEREGTLVFVAMPDEEVMSRGARSFRDASRALLAEWGLDPVGAINLDSNGAVAGVDGRSVFYGTVGKFSPFAHVVGHGTHAANPFDGISAHLIGAEILRALEGQPDLMDHGADDSSPPPVCLQARDSREGYDVTTPAELWLTFNWLARTRDAESLFALFRERVSGAAAKALAAWQAQGAAATGREGAVPEARILTFAELRAEALAAGADLTGIEAEIAGIASPLEGARRMLSHLVGAAHLRGPAVIIGFTSLYYPQTHVAEDDPFRRAVAAAQADVAAETGVPIATWEYFAGIADMSFLGGGAGAASRLVDDNTACRHLVDRPVPVPVYPVVNIGPWGRDAHQRYERVHCDYAQKVLPRLVLAAATRALGGAG